MFTADKDYFLDKDGKLTTDAKKSASLLARKGQEIDQATVKQYGIGAESEKKPADAKPAGSKSKTPAENK